MPKTFVLNCYTSMLRYTDRLKIDVQRQTDRQMGKRITEPATKTVARELQKMKETDRKTYIHREREEEQTGRGSVIDTKK